MSDAFTDIARDQHRGRAFVKFIEAVKEYVSNPNKKTYNTAVNVAKNVDDIRGGYWGGATNFGEDINNMLTRLIAKDEAVKKAEWAKFLNQIKDSYLLDELKALSPFAGLTLVFVDYGMGFVTFKGDFEKIISDIIKYKKMKTYDCDDYVVVLPKIDIQNCEAHWVRCGILGVNAPRKP